jgi:hypothetical protein
MATYVSWSFPSNYQLRIDHLCGFRYVFDESQLLEDGSAPASARSELWIIDARSMQNVVARVYLPQQVPYGLHGTFFSRAQIAAQRPREGIRK